MGDTRERAGAAGVAVAGVAFKIALYVCVVVLLFWIGKASYQFGHDVFNQQAMSPVFYVQERLSTYHGKLQPGTYLLSTAYTPNRIMGILAGDDEQEGVSDS